MILDFGAVEQVYARSQAIEQDPSLATSHGRAMREVMLTLGHIARGEFPNTVLGGIVGSGRFDEAADGPGRGRSLSHICSIARIDVENYDGVFTTQQTLDDLVEAGILEYDDPRWGSIDVLLDEEPINWRPSYILAKAVGLEILRLDPEQDQRDQEAAQARIDSRTEPYRPGFFERRNNKRWVKDQIRKRKHGQTIE